jgi:hypothetical protein
MTARDGMADLITDLRAMTNAGTVTWTDDQLQQALDKHRTELYTVPLYKVEQYEAGGSVVYREYYTDRVNLESGTAAFYLQDGTWATVGTALYTVDYRTGHITFSDDTGGTTYYLTARSYDLNRSAAQVWRQKAAAIAENAVDWQSDNHRVTKSQAIRNCMDMAREYERAAGPMMVTFGRGDTDA